MKRLSWKYVAGLVDGEGCLDFQVMNHKAGKGNGLLQDRSYIRPRVRVCLSAPGLDLLKNMHNNFGGHLNLRPRTFSNPMWADAYSWELHGKATIGFLQNIKNHLILKQNQAEFLLAYSLTCSAKHHGEPDFVRKFQTLVRDELKAMRKDPHRLSDPARILEQVREATVETILEPATA